MKPRPRLRKTAKWAGVVTAGVFALVWALSGLYHVQYASKSAAGRWCVWVEPGSARWVVVTTAAPLVTSHPIPGLGWERRLSGLGLEEEWQWLPSLVWNAWGSSGALPFWIPTLSALVIASLCWRAGSTATGRARAGRCLTCGYDRDGLGSEAGCPECGRAA
jgi:hypothetical protein